MPAEFVAQQTLGECVPIALTAVGAVDATAAVVLPQIEAQLAGSIEALAQITISPPSIEATIALLTAAIAALQALAELPGAELSIAALAGVIAELQATLGSIQAQVAISAGIGLILSAPGVWAYTQTGTPASFGSDFDAEIGGGLPSSGDPDLPIYSVTLIASDAGAIAALQQAFAG